METYHILDAYEVVLKREDAGNAGLSDLWSVSLLFGQVLEVLRRLHLLVQTHL